MGKSTCLTFAVLLLLAGRPASAVKSLKLDIPKDQAIVVEVPPNQWAAKETSWTGGIPISVLRADGDFIKSRRWENGSLPLLADFHIEKAQDLGLAFVQACQKPAGNAGALGGA